MQKELSDQSTRYSIDQADVKFKMLHRFFNIVYIVSIEKPEINRGEQRDNSILIATTSGSTTFHFHKNLEILFSTYEVPCHRYSYCR